MLRRLMLLVMTALLATALAAPASAVAPFGPAETVAADPGCTATDATGDADVDAGGLTHGFASFHGTGCTERLQFFVGSSGAWHGEAAPYRGRVLGVAHDTAGTFVLFANNRGVHVGRRSVTGAYSPRFRASPKGTGAAVHPQGDLVAAGGRWLAVWSEQVGPGGEFAQTELFGAQTIGSGHCFDGVRRRHRITRHGRDDNGPTLAMTPNRVRMVWERSDGARGLAANLHRGVLDLTACGDWRTRRLVTAGANNFAPDLALDGTRELLTWWRDGRTIERDAGVQKSFRGGAQPGSRIAHSAGTTLVAWDTASARTQVIVAERVGGTWTRANLARRAPTSRHLVAVTSSGGKATVLMFDEATTAVVARSQP